MQPLVSIITPSYNKQKFIIETIDSVVAQTYQNWELMIIDDNSTDNTAQTIKQWFVVLKQNISSVRLPCISILKLVLNRKIT
ncbi:MAG: glycosyltransferase [Bacteroidetes bacterium]|nr:glycosyltransferase [Bacteroidota bacterium]